MGTLKSFILFICFVFVSASVVQATNSFQAFNAISEVDELNGVQVPILRKDRLLNRNSPGNCGWTSLEILGRHAEIESLYNVSRPLNENGHPYCQGPVWDQPIRKFLSKRHIKYVGVGPFDKSSTKIFIQGCKMQRRGVGFDIKGHFLICVHYDPVKKLVKVLDNADRSLSIQTWDWDDFHKRWCGWAFYIIGPNDKIPFKYTRVKFPMTSNHWLFCESGLSYSSIL